MNPPRERLVLGLRRPQVAKRDLSILLSRVLLPTAELTESEPVVGDVVAELFSSKAGLVVIRHEQFSILTISVQVRQRSVESEWS